VANDTPAEAADPDEPTEEQRRELEFEHTGEVAELLSPHYDPKWGDLGHSNKIDDLPAAKVIRLAVNVGFGKANNAGFQQADNHACAKP